MSPSPESDVFASVFRNFGIVFEAIFRALPLVGFTFRIAADADTCCNHFEACYQKNHRMGTFLANWVNEATHDSENTWAHIGVYYGDMFGRNLTSTR